MQDVRVAQTGGQFQVGPALGQLGLVLQFLQARLRPSDGLDSLALPLVAAGQGCQFLLAVGHFLADLGQSLL